MKTTIRRIGIAWLLAAAPLAGSVHAADPDGGNLGGTISTGETRNVIADGVWSSPDGGIVTYESLFFEPYQAVTAADMLRWVPGGAALLANNRGGDQKRGFGSGGDQILINGKRLSGKSNNIGSAMQRIQADIVDRSR